MSRIQLRYSLISKFRAVLMGLSIILIMFCHLDIAQGRNGLEVSSLAKTLHVFTVGVDIFFFLSGLGLYYSYADKKPTYFAFEKRRLLRILPLYLVIARATYLIYDSLMHQQGFLIFAKDLSFFSWIIDGSTKYWNILALVVFYLLFPALYKFIANGKYALVKTALFSVLWFASVELLAFFVPYVFSFRIALCRLPIFVLGIFVGGLSHGGQTAKKSTFIIASLFGFVMFALTKIPALGQIAEYVYYPVRAALAVSIICTVILIFEIIEGISSKLHIALVRVFGWFGGLTLEMYLFHQSYMILMEYPYKLLTYPLAAFVFPVSSAAIIFAIRLVMKKVKRCENI